MTRADLPEVLPLCKDLGLAVPSAHFEYAIITNAWANYGGSPPRKGYSLHAALADARKAGLEYVVIPSIAPGDRGGMGTYLRLAQSLNQAGEQAKRMGLRLAYHNHSFEFRKYGQHTGFDILLNNIEKDLVHMELDPFWVVIGNQDPLLLMRKHAHSMRLLHLKDMRQYTNPTFEDTVPVEAFRALGTGVLDIARLMHSAHNAGVAHYFVHLDHFAGDALDGLRQSYDYLQKMKAAPELPT
jgi:sugar phosphate isomerase/epimerase